MSLRKTILMLVKHHQLKNFTVAQLRALCKDKIASKSLQHFNTRIYKQIWVMTKEGVFEINISSKENFYIVTEQGFQLLDSLTFDHAIMRKPTHHKIALERLSIAISDLSIELAEASAEAQEYENISRDFPDIQNFLQEKFIDAKSRAAALKGRLIAFENSFREQSNAATKLAN